MGVFGSAGVRFAAKGEQLQEGRILRWTGSALRVRCDSFLWNEWGASDGEGEDLEGFVF